MLGWTVLFQAILQVSVESMASLDIPSPVRNQVSISQL